MRSGNHLSGDGEEIRPFDLVEFAEPHDPQERGARGTVVLIGGSHAMVDFSWGGGNGTGDATGTVRVPYRSLRVVRPREHPRFELR